MTSRARQIAAAAAVATTLAAAGCGDSGEPRGERLPPEVTQALLQQLDSVSDRVAANVAGACDDIYAGADDGGNIEPIDDALASIPSDVEPEIRSALEESIDRLKQLVDDECAQIGAAERQEQETTPEQPVPEETLPQQTDTDETDTETTPETPPDEQPESTEPADPGADEPQGEGPDGTGPPGQDRGGVEAPLDGDGGDE